MKVIDQGLAENLGLSWPAPLCACGCKGQVEAYREQTLGTWKWRTYILGTRTERGHSPKRSVHFDAPQDARRPADVLRMAFKAYNRPSIFETNRLKHAAFICNQYLGGFRMNEALPLRRSYFQKAKVKGIDFAFIGRAEVEKSGGRRLDRPISLSDSAYIPLESWLSTIDDPNELVFAGSSRDSPISESGAEAIVDYASEGRAWPHLFRSIRTSLLLREFNPLEVDEIMGWSTGPSTMASWYGESIWWKYAARIESVTKDYWQNESLNPEISKWLDSIKGSPPSSE